MTIQGVPDWRYGFDGCGGFLTAFELATVGNDDLGERAVFVVDTNFGHPVSGFFSGDNVTEDSVLCV